MGIQEPPVGDSASAAVEAFLGDLQEHMGALVTDYDEWLSEELRQPFRDAFYDLESTFAATREWLQTDEAESALAHVGLAGTQLELKLKGFARWRERFIARPTSWAAKRVLGWGNIILGSLSGVFPPGEVIKELKEGLEVELEAREEEDREAG